MTKVDIATRIQEKVGVREKEAKEMLETVLSVVKETLEAGEKVKVSGFGIFEVKDKKDRKGRNPQTGETLTIGARRILNFRPSNLLGDVPK
jgi:integration host factor subunit alpha